MHAHATQPDLIRSKSLKRARIDVLIRTWAVCLLTSAAGCTLVGYGDGTTEPVDDGQKLVQPNDGSVRKDGGNSGDARVIGSSDAGVRAKDAGAKDGSTDAGLGTSKSLGCGAGEICTPDCEAADCTVSCAGALVCTTDVAEDSHASIDCKAAGLCDMDCKAGATCVVDCRDANDCDHLECSEGASCTLLCANNPDGCSLHCHGVAQTCANGVHVCDAPCPS